MSIVNRWPRPSRRTGIDLAWTGLLCLAALGPLLLRRGYALRGDMVFVPDQPWKSAWLGLDGAVPRFVPGEAVVWLLGQVLPGDLVQKVLLAGALIAAGWGMARITAELPLVARWSAIAVVIWNPWTYERLAVGQWPMLIGLAGLVWVLCGALRLRPVLLVHTEQAGQVGLPVPVLLGVTVSALAAPPSGLIAAVTAVVLCAGPARRTLALAGFGLAVNLPWIVPSLLTPGSVTASAEQFEGFALRGESGAGALASALSGGGIWKSSVVPPERELIVVVLATAVLVVAAVAALRHVPPVQRPVAARLVLLAGLGLAGAVLLGVGPVPGWLGSASQHVPALGLLRDAHRWLAPWLLAVAWGTGHGIARLREAGRRPKGEGYGLLAMLAPLLPVALLPSMVWGMSNTLAPVTYPDEWRQVQQLPPAVTVVLPWHGTYRGYEWAHRRAVLDPAPRMLPGVILIDDRHFLDRGVVLASEDQVLGQVATALEADDPAAALRALGVRRVLVEKENGVSPGQVPAGEVVHDGPELLVVDLGPGATFHRSGPPAAVVLSADLLAAVVLGGALVFSVRRHRREQTVADGAAG